MMVGIIDILGDSSHLVNVNIYIYIWLVVWNIFPYIGNVTIPTDFHIFRRVETTNQIYTWWVNQNQLILMGYIYICIYISLMFMGLVGLYLESLLGGELPTNRKWLISQL